MLGLLLLLLLLLFFCPKTDRADQTVRPRDLKFGQIVELNLGRTYQSLDPIGLTGALQRKIQKFQTFLARSRKPFDVDSKTLHRCNPWVSPNKSGVRNFCSTTHGFSAKLCYIRNLLLRTSPRFFTLSKPNHCRNILCTLNINNYQKKVEISIFARNSTPKSVYANVSQMLF